MNSKEIAAAIYVSSLTPGCKIRESEGDDIDGFRFELVEALHRRGLEAEPIRGGFMIVKRFEAQVNFAEMVIGELLVVGSPTLPGGPCKGGRA